MFCSKCGVKNSVDARFCQACGNPILENQQPAVPAAAVRPIILPASLGQRFAHLIVDSIATYIFAIALALFGGLIFGEAAAVILYIVGAFGYYPIFEGLFQGTLGKAITNTKVVNLEGGKPAFGYILLRSLVRMVPFEAFSYLFFGSYPTKGWHDRWSQTLVVSRDLTPEQVQQIDTVGHQGAGGGASAVIAIVVGFFVVLPIIGILASVVLTSLNTAREKANDAAIISTLKSAQFEAETYQKAHSGNYLGLCQDPRMKQILTPWREDAVVEYNCNDAVGGWATESLLTTGEFFCVDHTGVAKTHPESIGRIASCLLVPLPPNLPIGNESS